MANIRTTVGGIGGKFPSRVPGDPTAIQVNAFGMKALEGITGQEIAEVLLHALEPARDMAIEEWPKDTHASSETIRLEVTEIGQKSARVALVAGGKKLIEDPRNVSKKDYTPYIEFLGTPTTPPGTMTSSVILTEKERQQRLRDGIASILDRKLRG